MPIHKLEQLLDQERDRLGAASCTFYLRDPFWPYEFRLVGMPGVRFCETMHGFIFTERARQFVCSGEQEIFCHAAQPLQSEGDAAVLELMIQPELAFLFSDFAGREGIKSFARLFHVAQGGEVDAVLFVNFSRVTEFTEELKSLIREVLSKASGLLDHVRDELRILDSEYLAESVKILHPAQALSTEGLDWKTHCEKLLRLCLDALQISALEGLGTIHLYEPEKGLLKLVASCGNAPKIKEASIQSVFKGQGITSWVALKQDAILIGDMATSEFRHIEVVVNEDVKSELAVPMIVDGELVGVLNLESTREGAFRPASVRSIWYAASSAAVAYQLTKRAAATQRLLSICEAVIEAVRQAPHS